MKVTGFKENLNKMDAKQLQESLEALRRELFSVRLSSHTSHVKNHAQFNELRKNIARVQTVIAQQALNNAHAQ